MSSETLVEEICIVYIFSALNTLQIPNICSLMEYTMLDEG